MEDSIVSLFILFIYCVLTIAVGYRIIRTWFYGLPTLLTAAGAFLLGTAVSVPITYLFACLFSFMGKEPILWGTVTVSLMSCGLAGYALKHRHDTPVAHHAKQIIFPRSDIVLLLFSLFFSIWLMSKTFHGGADGQLFVGSNNVFDFGLLVGFVRSMSWGDNIPFTSPFFAGAPLLYHLFFQFWVAMWEYFGIPIVWAINIPSAFSFTAFLITLYYFPQIIAKGGKLVGWITVILTITHSTATFWHLLIQKGLNIGLLQHIWTLPTYPFAGPFDGSVISIFMTLNNFINQRHFAFALGYGLFLIMALFRMIEEKRITLKKSMVVGVLIGIMFLWNMPVCIFIGAVAIGLLFLTKKWKEMGVYMLSAGIIIAVSLLPLYSFLMDIVWLAGVKVSGSSTTSTSSMVHWTIFQYFWENLGILPIVALVGLFIASKKSKTVLLPFLLLFIGTCLFALVGKRGFEQKFISFSIIGINVMAAIALGWLWKKGRAAQITTLVLGIVLTVSGCVDLMVIKNEFAFPFISKDIIPIVSWINEKTQRNAVFISYADIIDPVVLAGRKNYFGFFGNIGFRDRYKEVIRIYEGDVHLASTIGISYILVPKWHKNDFPYAIDQQFFREHLPVAYEDEKYVVFQAESGDRRFVVK